MSDKITLEIPKKSEFISIIRLAASAIVNKLEFNIDEVDDIKIIISEISVMLIKSIENDSKKLRFEFTLENNSIKIDVEDLNEGSFNIDKEDLSMLIIESLADEFRVDQNNNKVYILKKCS